MMSPPSRIHHADRRNPLTPPAKPKSDSPAHKDRTNDRNLLRSVLNKTLAKPEPSTNDKTDQFNLTIPGKDILHQ